MREIRMLRARWRGLETEPRTSLHGHEGGNPGHSQGMPYGPPRQSPTLPGNGVISNDTGSHCANLGGTETDTANDCTAKLACAPRIKDLT